MRIAEIAFLTMRAVAAVIVGVILAEILRLTVGLSGHYITLVVSSLIVGGVAGYGTGVVAGRYEMFWASVAGALDGWWLFIDAPTLIGDPLFIRAWAVLTVPASMLGGYLRVLQRRGRHGIQIAGRASPVADRWAFRLAAAFCVLSFPVGFLATAITGNPRGGIFAFPLLGLGLVLFLGARRFH